MVNLFKEDDKIFKVLLVDDDKELVRLLEKYLSKNGIDVSSADSGKKALSLLESRQYNLVILDVMMPEMDGFEVLKEINEKHSYLPVMMLTAKSDEVDRIVGLEMGADDYLVKPFSSRELLARIKAIKRRDLLSKEEEDMDDSSLPSLELNYKRRYAEVRGKKVELSSIEFDILNVLIKNKGMVLSRKRIMELIRGKDLMPYDRTIDVSISKIRQKIEINPQEPSLIKTVWGVGYIYSGE